ncbi:ral guanine nucleotide dissociation stimulator-like [Rhynchonycteris naso]
MLTSDACRGLGTVSWGVAGLGDSPLSPQELFKKVVPHQCLASMWSQRNKPGKEHLTSTVCATVKHFNCVVTCVITTCLGDPSMKARDRAKVVEHWIKVAEECRALRNFSSLHAILSALRSTSVHRLNKTWKKVSRRNRRTMQKLCKEEDRSGIRGLLTEEKPSRLATLILRLRGAQKRLPKKCVPFLGTFLSDLDKLGTAMDCVKGTHVRLEIEKKVRAEALPGGREGREVRDPLASTLLGSIVCILHLLGEFGNRSGRPLKLVANGRGQHQDNFLEEALRMPISEHR